MSTDEPRDLIRLRETLESLGWSTRTLRYSGVWLFTNKPNLTAYLVAVLDDDKIVAGWYCNARKVDLEHVRDGRWHRRRLEIESRPADMSREQWAPLLAKANPIGRSLTSIKEAVELATLAAKAREIAARLDAKP